MNGNGVNSKLILLICSLLLLMSLSWFTFVTRSGFFRREHESTAQPVSEPTSTVTEAQVTATGTDKPPPNATTIAGSKHMFQTFNNCGPASLAMALSFYGIDESQQVLGAAMRPFQNVQGNNDDKSVTLKEIAGKAEEYGLNAYHRPAGNTETMRRLIAAGLPVITRTWLKPGEDIGHYRVVKGYDDSRKILIQDDSLQGKNLEYTYDEFEELWRDFSYEFVVLAPEEKADEVEDIFNDAGISNERDAWQKALQLAEEELAANPNSNYAKFNQSVAYYQLKEYDKSILAFEEVKDRLPSRMLWYQIEPIMAYYQAGNYEEVLKMTGQILNNHNRAFSELYYLRSQVYEIKGDSASAQAELEKAMRYNSTESWKVNVGSI